LRKKTVYFSFYFNLNIVGFFFRTLYNQVSDTYTFILTVPPTVRIWDPRMHYKCWYTGSVLQKAWWWLNTVETCCLKCNYIIKLFYLTGICTLYEVHVTLSLQRLILHKNTKPEEQRYFNNGIIPMCPCNFFLLEILYYLPISLLNSFPLYVFSFHQFYFYPFAVWFPFAVGQPHIPWVLRFSRVSMMLACWFVSNPLPTSVWAITRCPGSSSTQSHPWRYSQRRNFHPSAAISHIRFQFSTVGYTSKHPSREKKWGKLRVWPFTL
jgi:hypothetical protein